MKFFLYALTLCLCSLAAPAGEPSVQSGPLTMKPTATAREPGEYEERVFRPAGTEHAGDGFSYRLLSPPVLDAGTSYPVVLFLHGAGERGADNKAQLAYFPTWMASAAMQERYPCFVIAPQCPKGKAWTKATWSSVAAEAMPTEPTEAMAMAIGMLDTVLATLPVDPNRVYLTGMSMGGYGAWELAMRHPERFAAVVPICGGGDESRAARLVSLPIWAWHGGADKVVPVVRSRRMIDAIKKGGGEPRYTELPGVGHDSWTPAYTKADGAIPWMFEQVKR